jgi:hypothetical protein
MKQSVKNDESRLNQEHLLQEFAFFDAHQSDILQAVTSNRRGIKEMFQHIAILINNGFQEMMDLIELDNALTKMNTYIIIAYLNAVEDYNVELKYITRVPSLAFKMNLNKLKIIRHLKVIGKNTYLTELPAEIGLMGELRVLEITDCLIKKLPKEIGMLTKLEVLNIDGDPIASLPKDIEHLVNLRELHIAHNTELTELPSEIGELIALEVLQASHDSLKVLPQALARLAALREVDVSYNQLTNIPKEMAQLPQLTILKVDNNQIKIFPIELSKLIH